MSRYNVQLITMAEAKAVEKLLNEAGIGGGVTDLYDMQETAGPFGRTTDLSDPTAHLFGFKFANGAEVSAGLCWQTIRYNPVRWVEMLTADINREAHKRRDDDA